MSAAPLRIVHRVHVYPPEGRTGAENYAATLAAIQVRDGHTVAVYTRGHGDAPRVSERDGVAVTRDPIGPAGRDSWRRRDPAEAARWRAFVADFRPDVVHVQHLQFHDATDPGGGAPTVLTLHDGWLACPAVKRIDFAGRRCERAPGAGCVACFWGGRRARAVAPSLVRAAAPAIAPADLRRWRTESQRIVDAVDRVVSPSRFLRDDLIGRGVRLDRCDVVGFGPLRPVSPPPPPRTDGPLRIGVIGGHRDKGIGVAYAALEKVRLPAVALHHFGGDPAAMGLRVPERVQVGGAYGLGDLDRVFGAFDILAVPSVWAENFPMVVVEALARGRAVVASSIGGLTEMVRDGENGLWVPADDADALAAAWERLAREPGLRARLAAGARCERYADDHAREMEAIYRRAIDARQGASCAS